MTPQPLHTARRYRSWAAAVLVVLSLLGGLHAGDLTASHAARAPATMTAHLALRRAALEAAREQVIAAEQDARAARRRTARAALAALLGGKRDAATLLPGGLRFACVDRAAGRCAVVSDSGNRTISLVWPAYRPSWAMDVGLPAGACDGTARQPSIDGLSPCERTWLFPSRPGS